MANPAWPLHSNVLLLQLSILSFSVERMDQGAMVSDQCPQLNKGVRGAALYWNAESEREISKTSSIQSSP